MNKYLDLCQRPKERQTPSGTPSRHLSAHVMEDVDVGARTATTARKEITHVRDLDHDPLAAASGAAARSALAGEDRKYWSAHPEIPALVSYFLANGERVSEWVGQRRTRWIQQ